MQIGVITDTHFGHKGESLLFHKYFDQFLDNVFFPELERRKITTIIHGGDLYDRRKYINTDIAQRTRKSFLEKTAPYETHIMVGNHDVYFKDTNDVNSVREMVEGRYPNIRIYEEPEEVQIGGLKMLFIPWLNSTNMGPGLDMIKRSKCTVAIGHLEIAGFKFDRSTTCEHGMDRNVFKRFKRVYSGHFHTPSNSGNITYLGAPWEMTFADMADDRGFHIFDTETLEMEFIRNPYQMFHRIIYDDRDKTTHGKMLTEDFSQYTSRFLKVIVSHKTDPYLYDKWLSRLDAANPDTLQIIENHELEVTDEADEQFGDPEKGEIVLAADTITVLNKYVDAVEMELDKDKMKTLLRELLIEATQTVN